MVKLTSKVTSRLLDYFFLNPSVKKYINELAKLLDLDPKNTYRKLCELQKEGLLEFEVRGKEKFYFLNQKYPLLKEYRAIFQKTIGLEKRLKDLINEVKGIKEAYIFGSYAKNRMDVQSDIDILAIGQHSILDLQKKLLKMQKLIGREFNVINLDTKEFDRKKNQKDPFITGVLAGDLIKIK